MRLSPVIGPLIPMLVWTSLAHARELPSPTDLRAAYCIVLLKDDNSGFRRSSGNVTDPELKAAVQHRLAEIETGLRRLQRYLLPRLPYLDLDRLTVAIQSAQKDAAQRSAHRKMCAAQCRNVPNNNLT